MKKGFTLIELLVVVLIIGILAAIALPQYNLAVEKTRVTEAITVAHNLQKAIDIWLLSNGGYPSNVVDFLGDNTNGKGSLDIDVESTMDCSVESGTWCRSRDFQYKAVCGNGACWMYIHKMKPGTNSVLYNFEYAKNSHTQNTWQGGECDCSDGHPIGVKICQWLASQNVGHWVCNDC